MLDYLKTRLKSQGLYQSGLVIFGNAFTQGISAIAIILVTRLLGPTKFGIFSIGFSLTLILNRVNDLGMTYVVQRFAAREPEHRKINRIFSYTFQIKLIGSLVIAILGVAITPALTHLLRLDSSLPIYLAFIFNVVIVAYEHVQAMLQSLHRFSQSVVVNLIQSITKLMGAAVLFISGVSSPIMVLLLFLIGPIVPLLALPKFFPSWVRFKFFDHFAQEKHLITSLAVHSAIAFVAAGIIENIDILFVQRYLNTYDAGLLAGVAKIALLFNLAAYSLSTVLNPRVARYTQKNDIKEYLKKAALIVGVSVIGFVAFIPLAKWVILLSIGSQYLAGQPILLILMAAAFLSIALMPFMALFFSIDSPWYFSLTGLLQLVIIVGGNILFVPTYGLAAAAWTRLVARLVFFLVTLVWALYLYRRKYAHTS